MPHSALEHYWSGDFLAANGFIGLHLVGALLLGMLMGYERSYQGRAAGMRTYGLVWVLMGCLGGFEALGLVGVVLGPVVLTLARELWAERIRMPDEAPAPVPLVRRA